MNVDGATSTTLLAARHQTLLAIVLLWFAGTAAGAGRDPLEPRAPKQPPAFREVLSRQEYQQRSAKALELLGDLQELEKSSMPALGARILRVLPGMQAEGIGMRIGDVVVELGGEKVYSHPTIDAEIPQQVRYYSAATNSLRSALAQPRPLGISTTPHWRPEVAWLSGSSRKPAWDEHVLVGIAARQTDPDLAETAWHHAIKAGYKHDAYSASCGAALALTQGRPELAADFLHFVPATELEAATLVSPQLLYRVAIANYDLRTALHLASLYPNAIGAEPLALQLLAELHQARPESERTLQPPSQLAEGMYRDDLLPRSTGRNFHSIRTYLPKLRRGEPIRKEVEPNFFTIIAFGLPEPVLNVEVTVRLTARPSRSDFTRYLKLVRIGLDQTDPELRQGADIIDDNLLWVNLCEHSEVEPGHSGLPTQFRYPDPALHLDGETEHVVRLIRVGGQGEVFLNGKRILHVPVAELPAELMCYVQIIGMEAEIRSVTAHELIEQLPDQ